MDMNKSALQNTNLFITHLQTYVDDTRMSFADPFLIEKVAKSWFMS